MIDQEIAKQYAQIKQQIKSLESQAARLATELLNPMLAGGVAKITTDYGTFSLDSRKKWTYTAEVTHFAESLRQMKDLEEQTGKALAETTTVLRFTPPKNNLPA